MTGLSYYCRVEKSVQNWYVYTLRLSESSTASSLPCWLTYTKCMRKGKLPVPSPWKRCVRVVVILREEPHKNAGNGGDLRRPTGHLPTAAAAITRLGLQISCELHQIWVLADAMRAVACWCSSRWPLKATGKKRRKRGASCEWWWWTGCMSSVLLPLSSVASILLRTAGLNGGRGGPSRPLRLWGAVSPSRPCFSLSPFHFPLHYCSVATSGSVGVVSESGKKKPKEKMESTSLHTAERLFGCLLLLFHYFY
jgi:hypothetical protein